ncbi:hypothetical protein [Diaphorobacter sp. ED-3]|uniref:hypothetical protein n=1 Tax=Diaphorobacter sp. ED-3 TaxID=3016636 RepID=UPI0022DE7D73|nr:hypothetical protein [Diaphorobacter sp. ED-3]
MPAITQTKENPLMAGCGAVEENGEASVVPHSLGRVLGHHIHDGRNLFKPDLDSAWGQAIFGSKLAQQIGVDNPMLQWLYLSCVLRPQPPTLKSHLKRLVTQVAAAVGALFQPHCGDRRDGACDYAAKGKQAVDDGGVKVHGHYARPDADYVIVRRDPANETDVIW